MHKVLIANRGEIALRIQKTLKKMGIPSVAVFSEADRFNRHVLSASEAYCLGEGPSAKSYLRMDELLRVAKISGCTAIHPGYGFLAENADFATKVLEAGLVFVGPNPEVMRIFGSKVSARQAMVQRGVPVAKGVNHPIKSQEELFQTARDCGYPVLLKAAGGGGGKGMRIIRSEDRLLEGFEQCTREAQNAFSDPSVFMEQYLENAHHIEFQVLGDKHGQAWHFGHRECSVQRRHQKLIEETPSVNVQPDELEHLLPLLTRVVQEIGYDSLGTFEFLRAADGSYAFLEMNTRLQVEHSVTEMTYGVDLVEYQLRVAFGEKLDLCQSDLVQRGHAIECRICAEDCLNQFAPAPGLISSYKPPTESQYLRLDDFGYVGLDVPVFYDPMIAKVTVSGANRDAAIMAMDEALGNYELEGFLHNLDFHRLILRSKDFRQGKIHTGYLGLMQISLQQELAQYIKDLELIGVCALAIRDEGQLRHLLKFPAYAFFGGQWQSIRVGCRLDHGAKLVQLSWDGGSFECNVGFSANGSFHAIWQGKCLQGNLRDSQSLNLMIESRSVKSRLLMPGNVPVELLQGAGGMVTGVVHSPINGRILKVMCKEGQVVKKGELVLILEAMKMENEIRSPLLGVVTRMASDLSGKTVNKGDFLLELEPQEPL